MELITEIIESQEFDEKILIDIPSAVFFYAKWCSPCKMQSQIIYDFAEELKGKIQALKVDVDVNSELADRFGIDTIPAFSVFVDGKLKEKHSGVKTKAQLCEIIIKYL